MISFVAALGGLLFGYDWVVVGGAKPFYEPYFGLTTKELVGWANSCALLGCLLGSACSGVLMDRHGRKKLLLAAAVMFAVSSVGTGWAHGFDTFTFPILNERLGAAGTFWCYAAICFAGFVFVWRCVPETRGKSLEEIEMQLTRKDK
jgi:MFS family permease